MTSQSESESAWPGGIPHVLDQLQAVREDRVSREQSLEAYLLFIDAIKALKKEPSTGTDFIVALHKIGRESCPASDTEEHRNEAGKKLVMGFLDDLLGNTMSVTRRNIVYFKDLRPEEKEALVRVEKEHNRVARGTRPPKIDDGLINPDDHFEPAMSRRSAIAAIGGSAVALGGFGGLVRSIKPQAKAGDDIDKPLALMSMLAVAGGLGWGIEGGIYGGADKQNAQNTILKTIRTAAEEAEALTTAKLSEMTSSKTR